jgi:RNA polymerase sigma factor, sigma-70 family
MEEVVAQLINQIKERKPEALEKVIDLYLSHVSYLARKILYPIGGEEDIEECIQDTFLDAWRNIDKYNPDRGSFKTWLLILCKFKALSIRKYYLSKPKMVEIEDFSTSPNHNPENDYLSKEGSKEIIMAIQQLSPTDREIFTRRFVLNQEIDEISHAMKLTRKAIDNRLWRGRNQLKQTLISIGRYHDHEK